MSSYDLNQVIKMWEQEKLVAEQAIGQILLHLQALSVRIGLLEKRLEQIRQESRGNSSR